MAPSPLPSPANPDWAAQKGYDGMWHLVVARQTGSPMRLRRHPRRRGSPHVASSGASCAPPITQVLPPGVYFGWKRGITGRFLLLCSSTIHVPEVGLLEPLVTAGEESVSTCPS